MTEKHARERALELLTRVGLSDRAHFWPAQLSGGQRQRVAIAQQLVQRRRLVLLDEPFSGLDPIAISSVSALVREVADDHELNTVLIVTHDIRAALAVSDTIFLLGNLGPRGGARIRRTYDLVALGLAWEYGTRDPNGVLLLEREIEHEFRDLRTSSRQHGDRSWQ
jgi:polar amino acid transport system ATP-binding protein/sulfate transport system ATP-binding protein